MHKHQTGGYRAYKQINGKVYQHYSFDEQTALKMQSDLNAKSKVVNSLKPPNLCSKCGRLIGLRVRKYKKTDKLVFQLQVTVDGKQKKTERLYKEKFDCVWSVIFKLWRLHFGLSVKDGIDLKEQIAKAKRLYMQDIFNFQNNVS